MRYKKYLTYFLASSSLAILLALFDLEYSPSRPFGFIFQYIIALASLVILLLYGLAANKKLSRISGFLISSFFYSMLIISFVSEAQEKEALNRAGQIIGNIDKYKEEKGRFPESLEELVPTYMEEVPSTTVGMSKRNFFYSRNKWGYSLLFLGNGGIPYQYDNRSKFWSNES